MHAIAEHLRGVFYTNPCLPYLTFTSLLLLLLLLLLVNKVVRKHVQIYKPAEHVVILLTEHSSSLVQLRRLRHVCSESYIQTDDTTKNKCINYSTHSTDISSVWTL